MQNTVLNMTGLYALVILHKLNPRHLPKGVGSYLKLGGQAVMWGAQSAPLVEIELTDLPKPGCAITHFAHPSPTPL